MGIITTDTKEGLPYGNIVGGDHQIEAGMPDSFNVLVREIRSLGIDIDLVKNDVNTKE